MAETKAEVVAERDDLRAEVARLRDEHDRLKSTVVTTARAYAENHGWCEVVEEALQEMGVYTPRTVKVTVEIRDADAFLRMAEDRIGYDEIDNAVIGLLDMDGDFAYNAEVVEMAAA